jgi:transposase
MRHVLRASSLVPTGFIVEGVSNDFGGPVLKVRAASETSRCPGCGAASARIHSRYQRRLTDLPISNKPVRIVMQARRFHCDAVLCGRRIFAERFDQRVLAPWREELRALIKSSIASASH